MEKEEDPEAPRQEIDSMEVVFETEDHYFKSGYTGLFTNGTKAGFFDLFYIEALECVNKQPYHNELFFIPEDCNRF